MTKGIAVQIILFAYGQTFQPLLKLLINWADFRGELKLIDKRNVNWENKFTISRYGIYIIEDLDR